MTVFIDLTQPTPDKLQSAMDLLTGSAQAKQAAHLERMGFDEDIVITLTGAKVERK